jgi:MFS family permease
MRTVVGLTAVTSLTAFSVYQTLMPAFAKDLLGIGERDARYGLLFSAMGAGALIGVYLIGRVSAAGRRGLLMMVAALAFGATLPMLGQTRAFPVAIAILVCLGCAAISQLATANTLTQTLAPDRLRGRAVSAHMFAMGGLQPFGSFVAGLVAQRWGVPAALSAGGLVLIAYTAGIWLFRREVAGLA